MSHTVCDKIAQLSSDDMDQNLLQASRQEKNIHISVDTRYNTSGIRNSRRTGLPTATQLTLAMVKQTGKNYIVSAFTQNKMCPSVKVYVKLAGTLQMLELLLCTAQQMETCACTRVSRNP